MIWTFGLGKCSLVVTGLFFYSGKGIAVDRLVWFIDLVNMLLISFERGEESVLTFPAFQSQTFEILWL